VDQQRQRAEQDVRRHRSASGRIKGMNRENYENGKTGQYESPPNKNFDVDNEIRGNSGTKIVANFVTSWQQYSGLCFCNFCEVNNASFFSSYYSHRCKNYL
jgi:hypothetical protein